MEGVRRWDDLLNESTRLVADGPGVDTQFPSLERNLEQLDQLSRQLKARVSRYDGGGETAATRLLAREGIDADRLSQDLRSFELKTTFEDVFPIEAASVEEYLQQVHEMAVLAAIQEAQHEARRSCDDFMFQTSQAAWKKQKQDFLQSLSRAPALAPPRAPSGGTLLSDRPYAEPATSLLGGGGALAVLAQENGSQSVGERKAAAYGAVVQQLDGMGDGRQEGRVATLFKEAFQSAVGEERRGRSVDMLRIWQLVQSLLGEDGSLPRPSALSVSGMVAGARSHLEAGHAQYLLDVIHSHPTQAALGGAPGRLQRVQAFLRVRLRGQGDLDFDRGNAGGRPGIDTTWQQVYYCLRSGFYEEAKSVARSSPQSKDFADKLAEWVDHGGRVSSNTASKLADECDRMARDVGRQGRPGYDKRRMLVYTLVAGSRDAADRLLRDVPVLFSTIEDFMWFKLSLVRDTEDSGAASDPSSPATSSLLDLQQYLSQYPPSYYTKNGKEPLVYPYVLLLSLQFHSALLHLAKGAATEAYHVDAMHLAVVLGTQGALSVVAGASSGTAAPPESVAEVAALIRSYGGQYLLRGQAGVALEYYLAAAITAGGGRRAEFPQARDRMLTSCLRELLHTPSGMNLLLGDWGLGQREGMLKRLIPDEAAQRKLVLSAARDCLDTAQFDEATELFKRAEAFASALEIVNRRLSESMSRAEQGGDARASRLAARGAEILDAVRAFGGHAGPQERNQLARQEAVFQDLQKIRASFTAAASGRAADALRDLASLPYLPFGDRSVEQSAEALRTCPRVVKDRLQDAVQLLPSLLDRLPDTDGSVRQVRTKLANLMATSGDLSWAQATVSSMAGLPGAYGAAGR